MHFKVTTRSQGAAGEDDDDRGGVRADLVKSALDFVHVELDAHADIDSGIVQALAASFEMIDHKASERAKWDALKQIGAVLTSTRTPPRQGE